MCFIKLNFMNGRRLLPILVLILISFFFLLPDVVFAGEEVKNIVVRKGEIVDHDFFAAGDSVTISGVVNGDVYAAGATVSVDGIINGDLIVGAGVVTLSGEVSDDVRVGGGNIFISGIIGKNLTVGGGSLIVTSEAEIGGSLLAFTGSLDIKGPIGREANVFAGKAVFSNQVGGDLKGSIEELVLTSEAQILGNLEYESAKEATIDEDASVVGETTYKFVEKKEVKFEKFAPKLGPAILGIAKIKLYLNFFSFVISLIFGLVFLYFFPKRIEGINKILTSRSWGSLGVGLLTVILFPMALVFLTITIIGIPFMLLLIPLFTFLVYFSKIFASFVVGRKLLLRFEMKKSWNWALLVGLIVYYLLRLVPVISPIAGFAFTTLGLGAFVLDQKSLRRKQEK